MKKIALAGLALLLSVASFAQKDIQVVSRDYEIEKIGRDGLATTIELDKKYVRDLWKKQLKSYGKYSSKGSTYIVPVAQISSVSSDPVKLYSAVESSGKGTLVWLAIDMGNKHVVEGGEGYKAAENLLTDFAKSCYREDVQEQLKDAEKALESSVKKQDKISKEGEKLSKNFESNASEKNKLEEALSDNAKEKNQLQKDIDQNKKDRDAVDSEVDKMKKAFEIKQAELNSLK